jgi:hypothetical protein
MGWVHESLKERLSSVTTRSRVTSVTRPVQPRSTGVKTLCFGTGYYVIRANKLLLIAEWPRQLYTLSAVTLKKSDILPHCEFVFDAYKNAHYIPNSVKRKVFAMDTGCVFRNGVAMQVC